MDINYHYFAVKVLAVRAGFNENDAQVIASYSQFVDDFDTYRYLYFKEVPQFAQYLALKVPTGWIFNPVTTGFNSFFDYSRLAVNKYQKEILIPFHFIPEEPITVVQSDRRNYRVKPVTMNKESLLQGLLKQAAEMYKVTKSQEDLIRIGTLLHVFADTYAHQRFSGFWNWENHAYLKYAEENLNNNNITGSYSPNTYYYAPSIGHPNISTSADDSNVTFVMLQKRSEHENFPYQDRYERDNTTEFTTASREIINYLRACLGEGEISDSDWESIAKDLRKGLKTSVKDEDVLKDIWKGLFGDITFNYNKNAMYANSLKAYPTQGDDKGQSLDDQVVINIMNNSEDGNDVLLAGVNEDFFRFNVIADRIRKAVNPNYATEIEFLEYSKDLNLKDYTITDGE